MEIIRREKDMDWFELETFGEEHGLALIIEHRTFRDNPGRNHYAVWFKNTKLKSLRSGSGIRACEEFIPLYGKGSTESEAIEDYMWKISGKTLEYFADNLTAHWPITVPNFEIFRNIMYGGK